MKFLLKFLLLFSLIVVGKLVKEPIGANTAMQPASSNELPVHMASFFSRQATLQGTAPGDNYQWQVRKSVLISNN
jgi:hypothetical protein